MDKATLTPLQTIQLISKVEAAFELSEGKTMNFESNVDALISSEPQSVDVIQTLFVKGDLMLRKVHQAYLNADAITQPYYDFEEALEDFRAVTYQYVLNVCDENRIEH